MDFEHVSISKNLRKGSHTTIRFMEKEKSPLNSNNENDIFLFGNTGLKQGQLMGARLSDLAKPEKPPKITIVTSLQGLVEIGVVKEGIVNDLDRDLCPLILMGTSCDEGETLLVDNNARPSSKH